jgi:hypothetical protein
VRLLLHPIIKFYLILASFLFNFIVLIVFMFFNFFLFHIFPPASYAQLPHTLHARSSVFAALIGVLEYLVLKAARLSDRAFSL